MDESPQIILVLVFLWIFHYIRLEVKSWSRGLIGSLLKNALSYVITTGGRSALTILSRTGGNRSTWFVRYDTPHGRVNYPHININQRITGVRDPHIRISNSAFQVVGILGSIFEALNMVAFPLVAAFVSYDLLHMPPAKNGRTTKDVLAKIGCEYMFGYICAFIGDAIGHRKLPGVGKLIGALVGGITGGFFAGLPIKYVVF